MNRVRPFGLLLMAGLLNACTASPWYETGQNVRRQQCMKLPDTASVRRCLDELDVPYEVYRRERSAH